MARFDHDLCIHLSSWMFQQGMKVRFLESGKRRRIPPVVFIVHSEGPNLLSRSASDLLGTFWECPVGLALLVEMLQE